MILPLHFVGSHALRRLFNCKFYLLAMLFLSYPYFVKCDEVINVTVL